MNTKAIHRFSSTIPPRAYSDSPIKSCRYKAIFFDLDGTLIDTVPHICESYQRTYRAFSLAVPDDETVMAEIGRPLTDVVKETVPAALVDDFIKSYRSYNQEQPSQKTAVFWPLKNILNNLLELNVPMGVVTAKSSRAAWQNLTDFNLDKCFGLLIGHEDTNAHKPDPTPLYVARDKLRELLGQELAMRDILYVGDSRFDIACANKAGADVALVQWTRMPLAPINEAGKYFILYEAQDLQ